MSKVVAISRDRILERLAEIDAMLDILDHYSEEILYAERASLTWLLGDD